MFYHGVFGDLELPAGFFVILVRVSWWKPCRFLGILMQMHQECLAWYTLSLQIWGYTPSPSRCCWPWFTAHCVSLFSVCWIPSGSLCC